METKVVDARGEQCPIPVVKATKALQEMGSGTLEVHVDNAVAVQNLQRMASGRGLQAAEQQLAPAKKSLFPAAEQRESVPASKDSPAPPGGYFSPPCSGAA